MSAQYDGAGSGLRYVGEGLIGTGGGLYVAGRQLRALRQHQRGAERLRLGGGGKALIDGGAIRRCAAVLRFRRAVPRQRQCQRQRRRAQAGGQAAPAQRCAPAGQGTLGFLQQVVVNGRLPALYFFFAVHSIPSFSKAARSRCRVRNREDFTFSSPAPQLSAISRMLSPYQ